MAYKYDWNDKYKFIEDLKVSRNMSDFLDRQNLGQTCGNFRTFKKKISEHGIDYKSIFQIATEKRKIKVHKEVNLLELLCLNSKYSNEYIRKTIKKFNLINYQCSDCNNSGIWNNKELNLQLEHKNGNNQDNRIENLEYLCPNCHSQTSTFTGKNKAIMIMQERLDYLYSNNIKIINNYNIEKIAIDWGIKEISARLWILKNQSNFFSKNIKIELTRKYKSNSKEIEKKMNMLESSYEHMPLNEIASLLNFTIEDLKKFIRVYNPSLYNKIFNIEKELDEKNNKMLKDLNSFSINTCVQDLSKKWDMTEKEGLSWIQRNAKEIYAKIMLINSNSTEFIQQQLDLEQRKTIVLNLINKKQIPAIATQFGVSTNGLKKWIRNNLPDKFEEIYDDKHLIKNQKQKLKQEKEEYIKSLDIDFDQEEAISYLNTNKPVLFALIKKHNPSLIDKLHSKHLCPKCNSKSRTSGSYHRCLVCNHNFTPNL